jgi:hypothetical protein
LYSLVYATRASAGIKEFRDCQRKTFFKQEIVRSSLKDIDPEEKTSQGELFESSVGLRSSSIENYLDSERRDADKLLLSLLNEQPNFQQYGNIWPVVLAKHAVRKMEVDETANQLRKAEQVVFAEWAPRLRVPKDNFGIARAT